MKWHEIIQKYFGLIFFAAMAAGFLFSDVFRPLSEITYIVLGVIITISFLTLDYRQFAHTLKRFYVPVGVFIVYKLVIPAAFYYIISLWDRNIALAALLLAATPVGMITPALSQLIGADREFVLSIVVITSFAAPFYLPFLIKLVAGAHISVDPVSMMFSLIKLIFIPFAVSLVVRKWGKRFIDTTKHFHSALSVLLLIFVLLGIVAKGAPHIRDNWTVSVGFLGMSVVFCAALAGLGFGLFWFLSKEKRFGLAVSVPYMNLAMSIVIAAVYFRPDVLLFCIMYEVPVNLLPVILRGIKRKPAAESAADGGD
jgi:predicted Na+-dependent transporter